MSDFSRCKEPSPSEGGKEGGTHSNIEQPTLDDRGWDAAISSAEYYRLLLLLECLEPSQQLLVLRQAEPLIHDQITYSLHELSIQKIEMEANGQNQQNSFVVAFTRIFRRNPGFMVVVTIAFLLLIYDLGFTVMRTIEHVKEKGFWGGVL